MKRKDKLRILNYYQEDIGEKNANRKNDRTRRVWRYYKL